jgi:NitT/TauT family transport system permease protein
MAGELLVIIASQPALGVRLQLQREQSDAVALIGTMLVVLAVGIVVDLVVFGSIERRIRRRRGILAG